VVFGLIAVGVAILNDKTLGDNDGKVLRRRCTYGLATLAESAVASDGRSSGPACTRGHPRRRGYITDVRRYVADFTAGRPRQYLGTTAGRTQ
jgi:hypothetical protein